MSNRKPRKSIGAKIARRGSCSRVRASKERAGRARSCRSITLKAEPQINEAGMLEPGENLDLTGDVFQCAPLRALAFPHVLHRVHVALAVALLHDAYLQQKHKHMYIHIYICTIARSMNRLVPRNTVPRPRAQYIGKGFSATAGGISLPCAGDFIVKMALLESSLKSTGMRAL